MNLLILISFFVLTVFNYAEYPWVVSNIKAHDAAIKNELNNALNQYKKSNEILKNESKYERIELLLNEVRIMRFNCLAGKQVSVEKLVEFARRIGTYYDPLQIKLFDELYNLCFELYRSKQYKSCWWLLQRVQKMYLNSHDTQQLQSLKMMRISLQDLSMLAVTMLESDVWSKFLKDRRRRKYLLEEKLSDAELLGCGLASLRLANASYQDGEFSLSVLQIKASIKRLKRDISYLLNYLDSNQNRILRSHNLFVYLRSMIYGIQEIKDLSEILKDKVPLNQYLGELSSQGIKDYMGSLEKFASESTMHIKKFVADDFMTNYEILDEESLNLCNGTMKMIRKALSLYNIDNGLWLEFDAENNFEKAYRSLKNLASNRYMNPISRLEMRRCFSKLKFKHPELSTEYNKLAL